DIKTGGLERAEELLDGPTLAIEIDDPTCSLWAPHHVRGEEPPMDGLPPRLGGEDPANGSARHRTRWMAVPERPPRSGVSRPADQGQGLDGAGTALQARSARQVQPSAPCVPAPRESSR